MIGKERYYIVKNITSKQKGCSVSHDVPVRYTDYVSGSTITSDTRTMCLRQSIYK